VISLLSALAAAPAAACQRPPDGAALAAEVVRLVNAARAAAGLRQLAPSEGLMRAADRHACDMAVNGVRSHTGSDGSTFARRMTAAGVRCGLKAENIGWGPRSAKAMVDAWMASSQHRANILHPRMRNMAAAVARAPSGEQVWVLGLSC
jgi:uncharacterized protein YkwD